MYMTRRPLAERPTSVHNRLRYPQRDKVTAGKIHLTKEHPSFSWKPVIIIFDLISFESLLELQTTQISGLSSLLSSSLIGPCSFVHTTLCRYLPTYHLKSCLKLLLFLKFCFFVILMVLKTVSGPSMPNLTQARHT